MNPKHNKHKENCRKALRFQVAQTCDEEKILKVAREKRHITYRQKENKHDNISVVVGKNAKKT